MCQYIYIDILDIPSESLFFCSTISLRNLGRRGKISRVAKTPTWEAFVRVTVDTAFAPKRGV